MARVRKLPQVNQASEFDGTESFVIVQKGKVVQTNKQAAEQSVLDLPGGCEILTHDEDQNGYDSGGGTTIPEKVTGVQALVILDNVSLTWNVQKNLTGRYTFLVMRAPDSEGVPGEFAEIAEVDASGYVDTNLPLNGTSSDPQPATYWYQIVTHTAAGLDSTPSDAVSATVDAIPLSSLIKEAQDAIAAVPDITGDLTDLSNKAGLTGSIYCRGTGFNHSASRKLIVNSTTIYDQSGGIGLRLTVLDRSDLSQVSDAVYDTYHYAASQDDLASALAALDSTVIVVITSYDSSLLADKTWTTNLITQLKRCGGTAAIPSDISDQRLPYALIGIPGIGEANGLESITGTGATDPYAELSTSIQSAMFAGATTKAGTLAARLALDEDNFTVQIQNAQSTADSAVSAAQGAQDDADTANALLTDIASDNKLTPVEKSAVRNQWNTIAGEKAGIDSQADTFSVSRISYDDVFQALATYLNNGVTYTYGVPTWIADANLGTTTDIAGATFRANWQTFYNARTALLNALDTKAKDLADAAQSQAGAATVKPIKFYDFAGATLPSGCSVASITASSIENGGATRFTSTSGDPITRLDVSLDPAKCYAVIARVKLVSGSWDGTCFYINTVHGESGNYDKWISAPTTGNWRIVVWDMRSLTNGGDDFMTGGTITRIRLDFSGSNGGVVDVDWVAFGVFGSVSQSDVDAAQSAADDAQGDATTALGKLTDIASDNLLTADEKPYPIRDYAVITGEQSGIDAQATNYGITTEKTAYDTAITNLTNYLNGLATPVAWNNLTGNTTIVGTTFRAKFQDVYTVRQALLNKIADVAEATLNSHAGTLTTHTGQITANASAITATATKVQSVARAGNALQKSVFDSTLDKGDWNGSTSVVQISAESGPPGALEGTQYAMVTVGRDTYAANSIIPVKSGDVIYCGAWVNTQNTTKTLNIGFRTRIDGVDQNNWPIVAHLDSANEWTYISGKYTVPADVTGLTPFIQIAATSDFGRPLVQYLYWGRYNPQATDDTTAEEALGEISIQAGRIDNVVALTGLEGTALANLVLTVGDNSAALLLRATLVDGDGDPISNASIVVGTVDGEGRVILDADFIDLVGRVTAQDLNVSQLSAISADLGHVTAGLLESVEIVSPRVHGTDAQGRTYEIGSDGPMLVTDSNGNIIHDVSNAAFAAGTLPFGHYNHNKYSSTEYLLFASSNITQSVWTTITCVNNGITNMKAVRIWMRAQGAANSSETTIWQQLYMRPHGSGWDLSDPYGNGIVMCEWFMTGTSILNSAKIYTVDVPVSNDYKFDIWAYIAPASLQAPLMIIQLGIFA